MDALTRFVNVCEERGIEWFLASDHAKVTPEFRYELRVHGEPRFIERGSTPWEAAAKAADRLAGRARERGDGR